MKLTIFIAIIVLLRFLLPRLVDFGTPEKSDPKSEWHYRVKFAKLNKDKFEKATAEEKQELLYYFTHKLQQAGNYSEASFRNMPELLQVVWLINELEAEVNNGGYLQFFTNSSGRYADETLDALKLIGATYNHKFLKSAFQVLSKHSDPPNHLHDKINSKKLYQFIDFPKLHSNPELQNEMYEIDKKFYQSKENLSKLKMDYFEDNCHNLWTELEKNHPN
ncbi:MAG: DMP19 family protein [Muricauda sp.]|nr:DMP19 family protein [Allomuricauda sp.]MBA4745826.1 DMP19 family protein [Allomuricauda sp.]